MTGAPRTPQPAPRRAGPRRLGPGLVAFIVVDVVLVAAVVVMAVLMATGNLRGGADPDQADDGVAADEPVATPEPDEAATPEPPEGALTLTEFALPSRNIVCTIEPDRAWCDIASFSYQPAEDPECTGTVGHRIEVTAEGAAMPCVEGEPPEPADDDMAVLGYGESTWAHGFLCSSSENGVVCRHDGSGAGFTLARAGYNLLS